MCRTTYPPLLRCSKFQHDLASSVTQRAERAPHTQLQHVYTSQHNLRLRCWTVSSACMRCNALKHSDGTYFFENATADGMWSAFALKAYRSEWCTSDALSLTDTRNICPGKHQMTGKNSLVYWILIPANDSVVDISFCKWFGSAKLGRGTKVNLRITYSCLRYFVARWSTAKSCTGRVLPGALFPFWQGSLLRTSAFWHPINPV